MGPAESHQCRIDLLAYLRPDAERIHLGAWHRSSSWGGLLAWDLCYLKPQTQLPPSCSELQISHLAGRRGSAAVIMSAIIVPWGARGIVIQLCAYPGPLLLVEDRPQLLLEGAPLSELRSLGTSFHSFRGIHTLGAESLGSVLYSLSVP